MSKDAQLVSKEQVADLIVFKNRLPTLAQANEILIAEAMNRAKGIKSIAALLLGMSPQALGKRLTRKKQKAGDGV